MKTYTFSYYVTDRVAVLKRRPWWAFWRHDTIEYVDRSVRHSHLGLCQNEADILLRYFNSPSATNQWDFALLKRVMGRNPCMVQLEEYPITTDYMSAYVPTEGHMGVKP